MERVSVESSSIRSVGRDPASCTMEVEFSNGRVYRYFDVPEAVYDALLRAPSKGRYFNERVRGAYRYERI